MIAWDADWSDSWDVPTAETAGAMIEEAQSWPATAATIPAQTTPQYGSVFGVLDQVSSGLTKIATTVQQIRGQDQAFQLANSRAKLDLFKSTAALDIQRAQTGAAVDVERLRAQTAVAQAQRVLDAERGTTIFQAGPSRDWLMVALAAAGVYFAWRSAR